jgi:hypothetical protein
MPTPTEAPARAHAATAPHGPFDGGRELPRWLWLWFPPLILLVQFGAKLAGHETYRRLVRSELGLVEVGTVVMLVIALVVAVRLFLARRTLPAPWLGVWMGLFSLGALYFAGEEASWGQHYFGWSTPEALAAVNAQQETNIHNIGGVFDQLPRNVLALGILVGGVVLPIVRRRRHGAWVEAEGPMRWLLPTVVCLPTAVLASLVSLPEKLFEAAGREVPDLIEISPGETKEYYFGLFLMLYVLSLARRLRAERRATSAAPAR